MSLVPDRIVCMRKGARMRQKMVGMFCVALAAIGCFSGCAGEHLHAKGNDNRKCDSVLSNGAVSDAYAVAAEADLGDKITIESALPVTSAQRTVSQHDSRASAHAAAVTGPAVVAANINVYDASTGVRVYSSQGNNKQNDFLAIPEQPGANVLSDGVVCAYPGERVTVAMTPDEAAGFAQYGLSSESAAVAYIDVLSSGGFKAEGKEVPLPAGFPAVTRTEIGVPGVVFPPQTAPTAMRSALKIAGTGPAVQAEDSIVAQVMSVTWQGAVAGSTWEQGPTVIAAKNSPIEWRDALNGVKAGSQVVILMPADQNTGAAAQVVVVDVLAAG